MCGFIFSYTKKSPNEINLKQAIESIRVRGPDHTEQLRLKTDNSYHLTLVHSLLDISGNAVIQPYSDPKIPDQHLLFNGEIYNYQDHTNFNSDTASIIDIHRSNRENTPKILRGEYVFLIIDHRDSAVYLYTDTFHTKPCFIGRSDNPSEFGIASYPTALASLGFKNIKASEPNSYYKFVMNKSGLSIEYKFPATSFNLNPKERTYERFFECLIEATRLRARHGSHIPALSLSSGYDSGALSLALNLTDTKYQTISVHSGENENILKQRLEINNKKNINHIRLFPIGRLQRKRIRSSIKEQIENFEYAHQDDGRTLKLYEDQGSIGAYLVAQELRLQGIRVNFSGAGGDEIYSDYGHGSMKFATHSEFGGMYPENIESIFPWKKFYGDTQRSYLFKEEIIFGHFGIESRYPLLDRELVQEFLYLEPELKNREYKAPLAAFMRKYDYPFEAGKKRGFSAKKENAFQLTRNRLRTFFRKQ